MTTNSNPDMPASGTALPPRATLAGALPPVPLIPVPAPTAATPAMPTPMVAPVVQTVSAEAVEAAVASIEAVPTTKSAMEDRWGKNVIKAGYTMVPSIILRAQARLHINAVELAVLLHLLDHWWDNSEMPFPSKKRIAERLDVSTKTVQRAAAKLEAEGLVRRVKRSNGQGGQGSNHYDLSPLIEKIRPFADEALEANRKAADLRRSVGRNGGIKSWAKKEALNAKGGGAA